MFPVFTTNFNIKQDRKFTYSLTMRSIRVTIVAAEDK